MEKNPLILVNTHSSSMGDGWRDNHEAAVAFNDSLIEHLSFLYPIADIRGTVDDGLDSVRCLSADGTERDTRDVQAEIQEHFESWLESDEAANLF